MRTFETQGGPQQREVALLNEQQAALLISMMRNKQTKALIRELGGAEIPAGPVLVVNDGVNNGTYVVKELVYAYAMWISPDGALLVGRARLGLKIQPVDHSSRNGRNFEPVGITATRS